MKATTLADFCKTNAFYRAKLLGELVKVYKDSGASKLVEGETNEMAYYKCVVLDAFLTQEPKLTAQAKEGNYQMEVAKFAFGQTVKNFIASWKVADKKWIEVAFFHRGIHNVVPIP